MSLIDLPLEILIHIGREDERIIAKLRILCKCLLNFLSDYWKWLKRNIHLTRRETINYITSQLKKWKGETRVKLFLIRTSSIWSNWNATEVTITLNENRVVVIDEWLKEDQEFNPEEYSNDDYILFEGEGGYTGLKKVRKWLRENPEIELSVFSAVSVLEKRGITREEVSSLVLDDILTQTSINTKLPVEWFLKEQDCLLKYANCTELISEWKEQSEESQAYIATKIGYRFEEQEEQNEFITLVHILFEYIRTGIVNEHKIILTKEQIKKVLELSYKLFPSIKQLEDDSDADSYSNEDERLIYALISDHEEDSITEL